MGSLFDRHDGACVASGMVRPKNDKKIWEPVVDSAIIGSRTAEVVSPMVTQVCAVAANNVASVKEPVGIESCG